MSVNDVLLERAYNFISSPLHSRCLIAKDSAGYMTFLYYQLYLAGVCGCIKPVYYCRRSPDIVKIYTCNDCKSYINRINIRLTTGDVFAWQLELTPKNYIHI